MIEPVTQNLDSVFFALGHPVRRQILVRLMEGPAKVTDIARPYKHSLNAISKHLKVLEKANLIQRDVVGREHFCRLNTAPLEAITAWLAYYQLFWTQRFDAIEQEILARKQSKSVDEE